MLGDTSYHAKSLDNISLLSVDFILRLLDEDIPCSMSSVSVKSKIASVFLGMSKNSAF